MNLQKVSSQTGLTNEKIRREKVLSHIGLANETFRREHFLRRVLPEIGKIKIGQKKVYQKNGVSMYIPQRLDHFLITSTFKDESGNYVLDLQLMKQVSQVTKEPVDRITRIPIVFPFSLPELNFQTWYISPVDEGEGIFCIGDGIRALRRIDKAFKEVECPCDRVNENRCKRYGRLNCIIREANIFGGVWVFRTSSRNTIESLLAQLELYKRLYKTLLGTVFLLTLVPMRRMTPNGYQTIYTVQLLYDHNFDNLENTAIERVFKKIKDSGSSIKEIELEERKMLEYAIPNFASVEIENIAEIQEEFFPEQKDVENVAENIEELGKKEKISEEVKETDTKGEKIYVIEKKEWKENKEDETKQANQQVSQVRQEIEREHKEKLATVAQVSVIKRMIETHIGRNTDIDLNKISKLTFDEAVKIINLFKNKKEREAYEKLLNILNIDKERNLEDKEILEDKEVMIQQEEVAIQEADEKEPVKERKIVNLLKDIEFEEEEENAYII